jgi:uridine kinase
VKDRLVIGITGGSGSGKTHFLNKLMDSVHSEAITLFSMDNYYRPIDEQEKDENGIENFDKPESIDRKKFYDDLQKLKAGESIRIKEYHYNYLDKEANYIHIPTAPVIIVEGIFTFYYEEIRDCIDLKLYIDTPDYLMLKRRILRDAEERGYDLNDVLYRFEHHVTPAFQKYILPSRQEADLIIPNHHNFDRALEVVQAYIHQFYMK